MNEWPGPAVKSASEARALGEHPPHAQVPERVHHGAHEQRHLRPALVVQQPSEDTEVSACVLHESQQIDVTLTRVDGAQVLAVHAEGVHQAAAGQGLTLRVHSQVHRERVHHCRRRCRALLELKREGVARQRDGMEWKVGGCGMCARVHWYTLSKQYGDE